MRALSLRQAARCETAKCKTCKCRCGGTLHGAFRNFIEEGRERNPDFYQTLPEDDPHHVRSEEEKKRRARLQRAADKARGQGLLWSIFSEENV